MPEDLPELGDAELEQALVDLGANMPSPRTRDLTDAVLQRIAAGGSPPGQPSSGCPRQCSDCSDSARSPSC